MEVGRRSSARTPPERGTRTAGRSTCSREMNTGELAIADALAQIEAAANEALAADRAP